MDQETLNNLLVEFLNLPAETEWLEFKLAKENFDTDYLGQYFSALSNEANLKSRDRAWLIFGINDNREIEGTNFKNSIASLNELKRQISMGAENFSFIEIHQCFSGNNRVLMFEIAPAPPGVLVSWKRIPYGREGESLGMLSESKKSIILSQDRNDWSGKKCLGATCDDFDLNAIEYFKQMLSRQEQDSKYLNYDFNNIINAFGLAINGVPLNFAMVLFGKTEVVDRLLPDRVKLTWKYEDEENSIVERKEFRAPFITQFDDMLNVIDRFNFTLKETSLFRKNERQYDEIALRELLVNALAHRDWTIPLWIELNQSPISISFKNPGIFRADIMDAIENRSRPPYLNKKLADLFQKLKLMEREGGGLRKVFRSQIRKGAKFTFNFNEVNQPSVEFTLHGKIEDLEFAHLIANSDTEINIQDLVILDKIRSGNNTVNVDIDSDKVKELKNKGYIETRGGRTQKIYISASLSKLAGEEANYTQSCSIPADAKILIITKHIKKFGKIKTSDAVRLFSPEPASSVRIFMTGLVRKNILKRIMPSKNRSSWFYVLTDILA